MHLMTSVLTYLSRLFTREKKIEKKNCIVSERKGITAVCVLTPRLFSYSTLTSRLGLKKGLCFFVLFLTINKVLNCPQRPEN